jgi:hypothetical protein
MIPEITIKISFGGEGGQSPSVVTKPVDTIEIAPPALPADAAADVDVPPPPSLEDVLRASDQVEAIPPPPSAELVADVMDLPPPPE